ncbi:HNH endonuclease domain-containing protein [Flavitalea sp. BT771]|uniref:type II CRISPR RNA-guided endonuclease Cas9 n=1 Tax=Flavitalea sp. BT771 TaxID=3063329 RepID=UPI0026E1566F|nr:type II CRISPR RNA-guided endonuclease Cas9 [Flavitalea sp. BT771]MDO6433273.1 HNH endonuclease domain-containing protein [Flavitalea sp. BT771]MDV6222822.1 HNH endonuclease domain-containing protein [Flavitalea sp. BT771]
MSKVLGLDLGTNSIGWAIRDTEGNNDPSQITHKGVVIFEKGVGKEKGIEFSRAAERTKHKSARKKNRRRRWRKIDLLAILIKNNMCPLSMEELEQWKTPAGNREKKYPESNIFRNWLRLDFNNDGLADYANPFELRANALQEKLSLHELGRIAYHINQRRGYLSNRSDKAQETAEIVPTDNDAEDKATRPKKLGKVATAIGELEKTLAGKTIGQKLSELIAEGGRGRRRKEESTNISRITLQSEFLEIAGYQGLSTTLTEAIRRIIFDQRPLRSQKGTIGKCIYEKDKPRCPVSHPEYELYRMWQILNNIKYSDDGRKTWQPLNAAERQLAQQKFFRRSSPTFEFSDISKVFMKHHPNRVFNYKNGQTIAGCPTLAGLIFLLGEERTWQMRGAAVKRIKWEESQKGPAALPYPDKQIDLYDLWHWLFAMDNDKDQAIVRHKVSAKLGFSENDADKFVRVPIKQGYGSLSLKAIRKINHWLEQGEKYDKAVFLANVPYILNHEDWKANQEILINAIQEAIDGVGREKNCTDIANGLINHYNNLPYTHRFAGDNQYTLLDEDDQNDINSAILNYFGEARWKEFSPETRSSYEERVKQLYQLALSGAKGSELTYLKPPRLDQNIKNVICQVVHLDPGSKVLNKLFHPSDIDSFLPAFKEVDTFTGHVTGRKLLNSPITESIRNPMAMRALYELRKLINYLIKQDIIDEYTHVIVEMARELNDANRRKAIERYQSDRKRENDAYEREVRKIFSEQGRTLPGDMTTYVERYRLRKEQPRNVCMYTGRTISDTDLFDEFTTDIEHTLPRSLTFEDSLENKTIAFKFYNNHVKDKLFPSQLPNYSEDTGEYTAIEPRLSDWKKLVEDFENKIEYAKKRSRLASTKEVKDKAIEDRHYYEMHRRYWKSKLERFTLTQITEGFKNSQLVDTQLIAKYGVLFLKTLFIRVRSTKGSITDKIKRVWGAMGGDEKKNRTRHTHHAIDAIIQTLLHKEKNRPDIYNLLAESYREAEDNRWKEPKLPNPWNLEPDAFYSAIQELADGIIICHADRDNVLKQTRKKQRDKGDILYLKNEDGTHRLDATGKKMPIYQRGRGIRASLHKDTFYGAIKVPVKEDGKFKFNSDGQIILEKGEKDNDQIRYRTGFVFRGSTADEIKKNIEKIVDDRLRMLARQTGAATIHKQGYFEIPPSEERKKRDKNAQATKVFKVKIFADNLQNPILVKEHPGAVKDHKKWYYSQTDGNYLMALYDNGKEKDFMLVNTFELAGLVGQGQGLYLPYKEKIIKGKPVQVPLLRRNKKDVVLTQGIKLLLFEVSPQEIFSDVSTKNLSDRLFKVQGLSIQRIQKSYEYGIIQMIHHLEARPLSEMKIQDGDYRFGDGKTYRKMNHNQLNALIEGIDFYISPIGAIVFVENEEK